MNPFEIKVILPWKMKYLGNTLQFPLMKLTHLMIDQKGEFDFYPLCNKFNDNVIVILENTHMKLVVNKITTNKKTPKLEIIKLFILNQSKQVGPHQSFWGGNKSQKVHVSIG